MITGAMLALFGTIFSAIFSILPSVPVPSWLSGSDSAFGKVFAFADSMSPWFPVPLALSVAAALLLIKATGFAIKVGRMVLSLFTGGGGSAA